MKLTKAQQSVIDHLDAGCVLIYNHNIGNISGRAVILHPQGYGLKISMRTFEALRKMKLIVPSGEKVRKKTTYIKAQ